MSTLLLDPTGELSPAQRLPLAKPASLAGLTVGLLDISKARGDVFLDRLETLFQSRGVKTLRFKKPTFTKPAPLPLIQEIAGKVDVVVEALAD
ncbi:MAG: hypothetical protein FJ164_01360 [Gammaproteobacteria bacterium]|nr:hypothetical protein [Gammaproteobacteria bacterium]